MVRYPIQESSGKPYNVPKGTKVNKQGFPIPAGSKEVPVEAIEAVGPKKEEDKK